MDGFLIAYRGAPNAVEVPKRLLGPKESTRSLSGHAVVQALDFNQAVRLAVACPIFDEDGSVEIARLG